MANGDAGVWRYYLLKGYALVVGAVVLALGVLGALPHVPPIPLGPNTYYI